VPSHVPRADTSKKQEQLRKRVQRLTHAIAADSPQLKQIHAAEAYRLAHLSLLKAESYWIHDWGIRRKTPNPPTMKRIAKEIDEWTSKTPEEVLYEFTERFRSTSNAGEPNAAEKV
jgi:hypothetical protein